MNADLRGSNQDAEKAEKAAISRTWDANRPALHDAGVGRNGTVSARVVANRAGVEYQRGWHLLVRSAFAPVGGAIFHNVDMHPEQE
jgi:hypothetical protein